MSEDRMKYTRPPRNEEEFIRQRLVDVPPVPCDFQVGDIVTFTNEYGVSFPGKKIIGFAPDDSFNGRFVHLSKEAFWFPNRPEELTLEYRPSQGENPASI